jgi:uncharacterized RDD family membrane protein YckC
MDILKIDSSRNIDIEESIGSIGERIVAALIDLVLIIVFLIVFSIVMGLIFQNGKGSTFWILSALPVLFYALISEWMMNGQTWGKKVMKLKVVKTDGTPVSFLGYFLRWILGLIEIWTFLGSLALAAIIINQRGQRLGDLAAGTSVIRLRNKKISAKSFFSHPDNYTLVFSESKNLSINDIYTIEEVLDLLKKSDHNDQATAIANKAREVLEKKLDMHSNLHNMGFFQTLLNDYYFLNSK